MDRLAAAKGTSLLLNEIAFASTGRRRRRRHRHSFSSAALEPLRSASAQHLLHSTPTHDESTAHTVMLITSYTAPFLTGRATASKTGRGSTVAQQMLTCCLLLPCTAHPPLYPPRPIRGLAVHGYALSANQACIPAAVSSAIPGATRLPNGGREMRSKRHRSRDSCQYHRPAPLLTRTATMATMTTTTL